MLVSNGIHWKLSFSRHFLIIFFLPAQHVARLTWVPSAEASSNHHGKKCSLSWAPRVKVVKAQVFGETEARRAQVTSPRHKTSFQQNTSCVPTDPHITWYSRQDLSSSDVSGESNFPKTWKDPGVILTGEFCSCSSRSLGWCLTTSPEICLCSE